MKCSLIVATYNWPQALRFCLDSIMVQSLMPDEVIIADDGSTGETQTLIEEYQKKLNISLLHIWQKDEGFRLARIRNKAFAKASFPYILQIDGDLILNKHFVKDHMALARPGYFVTGSRVLLSPKTTGKLFDCKSIDVVKSSINNKNFFNGLRVPILQSIFAKRYKNSGKNKYYVKGCNMAFWKKDLVAVNGYNEIFTGWGREDSELAIRLINLGVKKQFIKLSGICYHLYHKEAPRELEERNSKLMNDAIFQNKIWAPQGLESYLSLG